MSKPVCGQLDPVAVWVAQEDLVGAVAGDGGVVGDALDDALRNPAGAEAAEVVGAGLGMAAEADGELDVVAANLPGVAEAQPLFGLQTAQ